MGSIINKPGNEEIYVKEVRISDLEKPGDDDIIDKLLGDFESKNLGIAREEIIKKIEECERLAVEKFSKTSRSNIIASPSPSQSRRLDECQYG